MHYSNLHTHTTYSDGKHTFEENILSAIEKHMVSLGFSDHSYTPCDTSYCMKLETYSDYVQNVLTLKDTYKDKLPIYLGLELDYYSAVDSVPVRTKSLGNGIHEDIYVDQKPFAADLEALAIYDYLIASVHYIIKNEICYPIDHSPEQQIDCIQNAFNGDIFAMIQCYFDMLCEHVERVKPTVVGHLDVITKFSLMPEHDERYHEIGRTALTRILRTCPYIEVNTGAIARGLRTAPYPGSFLLKTIWELGGHVVLGSDSHHKDNLIFAFDETIELLRHAGFDHVCMFNGHGFDSIAI